MKNKMMEQDVENMGIMAGFKDMMEMDDEIQKTRTKRIVLPLRSWAAHQSRLKS
jgi:hypothetical protein